MIENAILVTPFLIFLLYKEKYFIAIILLALANLLGIINIKNQFNFSIPTPFYKYPFEFTVGFRKTYIIIFLSYILTCIAVIVSNFNLGLFALLLTICLCISFYTKPEPIFYVWIFSSNSKIFLLNKIKIAALYTAIVCFPITATLSIFYVEYIYIICTVQLLGILIVVSSLLGKYVVFPSEINLQQIFAIVLSAIFLPLLLFVIPVFFIQSTKRLSNILKDDSYRKII